MAGGDTKNGVVGNGPVQAPAAPAEKPSEKLRRERAAAATFRAWRSEDDEPCLKRICHLEWDYLPRMIGKFSESCEDHPRVLVRPGDGNGASCDKVVALGNLQHMNAATTWLQAIRVDPAEEGSGYGSELMTRLLTYSKDLGCSVAMSSTSTSNARMLHIFDKLGFRRRLDVAFFPSSSGLQAAINASRLTLRPGSTAEHADLEADAAVDVEEAAMGSEDTPCFLESLGVERQQLLRWREEAEAWEVCRDVEEVERVMEHVGEEARAKGLDVAVGFVCAEYRVYSVRQREIASAILDGRVLVCRGDRARGSGRGGGGWGVMVVRRSSEMRGRAICGLTTACEELVGPALAKAQVRGWLGVAQGRGLDAVCVKKRED